MGKSRGLWKDETEYFVPTTVDFPGDSDGKESACMQRALNHWGQPKPVQFVESPQISQGLEYETLS